MFIDPSILYMLYNIFWMDWESNCCFGKPAVSVNDYDNIKFLSDDDEWFGLPGI